MPDLRTLITRVRLFYSPDREPLRRSVYTTILGIVGAAVTLGLITGTVAVAIGAPLAGLLAVPAVEHARSKVTPTAKLQDERVVYVNDEPGQHSMDRVTP